MAIFVTATLLAVLSMCNVALAFGAVDMPHPFGYNRDGMDEYVLRDCLEAGDLSFLGDAETVRAIYEMRSGPYDGSLLQTQVVVTVPDTSESAPITEWGPPIDLGTGMPNHGAVMFSLGDGPVQDGTFIAEMWVPSNFTEPLPLIVNTPPMQSPYSYRTYREVMRKVATYGFIMIVSAEKNSRHWKSEVKIGDRGIQLKQFVEHQNEMPESLLYGKWNGKAGVWGMSMGGGAAMYAGINPDSGFDAIYALAPTYHASDPKRREGGFGAWSTADLKVPLFATGEEQQDLVDAQVHEYFGEEQAPRVSVVVKGASHYTMKNFFFSSMWMAMFFQLYLKGDTSVVPALWGPRTMEGSLAGDRDAISLVRRTQMGLAINGELDTAPWNGETFTYSKARATNRRDYRTASICVVDVDTGDILDAVRLDRKQTKDIIIPEGADRVALVDLEDFTALYAVRGMNF